MNTNIMIIISIMDKITIESKFLECIDKIKHSIHKPSDDDLLELYGLYKQSTVGDINIACPSFFIPIELAKWNSWNFFKGISKQSAKERYIVLVETLFIYQ
jgi:diazepam-binding inhibitor (GABA receptor modulating acyl-CoA-binding protein)